MTAEEFVIIGKYVLNRVGFKEFKELMERALDMKLEDSYLNEKWGSLRTNYLNFLISYKEFTQEVINEIEKIGYRG